MEKTDKKEYKMNRSWARLESRIARDGKVTGFVEVSEYGYSVDWASRPVWKGRRYELATVHFCEECQRALLDANGCSCR